MHRKNISFFLYLIVLSEHLTFKLECNPFFWTIQLEFFEREIFQLVHWP